MANRKVIILRETVPEDYVSTFSIVIHSKDSERNSLEYDLVSALIDMAGEHPHLKNVEIVDNRL